LTIALLAGALVGERMLSSRSLEPFEARRQMMDTWVSIVVYDTDPDRAARALDAAFSRMDQVVSIASTHDPSAEAARLNADGELSSPSPELVELITASQHFYQVSGGTFDIAIESLLALWRYDPASEEQFWEIPPADQRVAIAEAMSFTGADRIAVIAGAEARIALAPGMRITLDGIAKGYVADEGLRALKEAGIEHALIDAGGDIAVMGGKPGGAKWEVALRDPDDETRTLARFALGDGAIATSGNYLRYFDPEAEVGHIMDPRTGYSAATASSATVTAPTCMEADALATAVFVLGPTEGIELVDRLDRVEAMVLGYEDPTLVFRSQRLDAYEVSKKDGP
jgi:thiamine biosynthesis lipoprotein